MQTVRVIVTDECNRHCKGCCNNYLGEVDPVEFEDLLKYDEIVITGGEPMMIAERVVEFVHRLRFSGFTGKIWLYTANSRRLDKYWAVGLLIDDVDGMTYTIHNEPLDRLRKDLADLRRLDKYLAEHDRAGKSDRLYIDSRVYDEEYVKSLAYQWAEIKPLEWKENGDCPLPENEVLVFYDLERV